MKLIANALSCERNGRVVFSGLSFAVGAGKYAELRGPNGSGKSTLLRLLAGLVPAMTGTVSAEPAGEHTLPQLCHYIGHHDALKNVMIPVVTVIGISFGLLLSGSVVIETV